MALTSGLRRLSLTWDSGAASSQVHGVRRLHHSSLVCTTLMYYTGVHVTTVIRGEAGWALSGRKWPKAAQAPAPEAAVQKNFQRNCSCWALTTRELGKTAKIKGNRLWAKVKVWESEKETGFLRPDGRLTWEMTSGSITNKGERRKEISVWVWLGKGGTIRV